MDLPDQLWFTELSSDLSNASSLFCASTQVENGISGSLQDNFNWSQWTLAAINSQSKSTIPSSSRDTQLALTKVVTTSTKRLEMPKLMPTTTSVWSERMKLRTKQSISEKETKRKKWVNSASQIWSNCSQPINHWKARRDKPLKSWPCKLIES